MKIDLATTADAVRLRLAGRLDAAWSDATAAALEQAVRSGRSRIELDLAEVSFMSSVGIGVIVAAVGRFRAVGGTLAVVEASDAVRTMLKIARLESLLSVAPAARSAADAGTIALAGGTGEDAFEGSLRRLDGGTLRLEDRPRGRMAVSPDLVAFGQLALAEDERAAAGRFGEGLVVGGTIAVMPAEATRPDCLASGGREGVEAMVHQALLVRGAPCLQGFFEAPAGRGARLSDLARALVEQAGGPVAFVAAGECAGAFGAWARSSPDSWPASRPDSGPSPIGSMDAAAVRRALRYSGEPIEEGETAVVAGVARVDAGGAAPERGATAAGGVSLHGVSLHAHVAVAAYRPLPRTATELSVVGAILAEQPLRIVMHALRLERDGEVVETRLRRGSVWVFRLDEGASA